jgi:hypothetical protein
MFRDGILLAVLIRRMTTLRWIATILFMGTGLSAQAERVIRARLTASQSEESVRVAKVEEEYKHDCAWLRQEARTCTLRAQQCEQSGLNRSQCAARGATRQYCDQNYALGIEHLTTVKNILKKPPPTAVEQLVEAIKLYFYGINKYQGYAAEAPLWVGAQAFKKFANKLNVPPAYQKQFWDYYAPARDTYLTVKDYSGKTLTTIAKNCLKQTALHTLVDDCKSCEQVIPDLKQAYRDGQRRSQRVPH